MPSQDQRQGQDAPPWAIFESEHYLAINVARWEAAAALIRTLPGPGLENAYDVGCGPGWFIPQEIAVDVHRVNAV